MSSTAAPDKAVMAEAIAILESSPLIDGHNDWMMAVRNDHHNIIQGPDFEPDANLPGQVDLKRLRSGRMGGMFLSAYMPCPEPEDDFSDTTHLGVIRDTLQQIETIHRLMDRYPDHLRMVSRADEILPTFRNGHIPCMIGVEGLHQIGNSASILRLYWQLGVRYVTLTHVQNNLYADSANSTKAAHDGLSAEGELMIREMNRIGMIIDLSHVSDATMHQVLDSSEAPVLFTHSNARSLCDHERNVPDECLDKLQKNQGVVMVTFVPKFTSANVDEASAEHVVDHIEYIAKRIGYDHIGIGSDFDGTPRIVKGVVDAGGLPRLVAAMLQRSISRANIEKILGLNAIRVIKAVEEVSASKSAGLALEDEAEPRH